MSEVPGPVPRGHPASGQRSRRQGPALDRLRQGRAVLRLDSPLRSAHAVRAARAVPAPKYKGHPYRGRGRVHRRAGRPRRRVPRVAGPARAARSSRCSATTARAWAITAKMRTASSSTRAATRVPFIIRAPFDAARGRRVADPVRVVDLMPTVLDLLALPAAQQVSGTSLVPLMTGATIELGLEGYAEAMYPLHHYGWSDLRALRSGRFKVIDAPRPELYDLETDPGRNDRTSSSTAHASATRWWPGCAQMEQAFEKVAGGARRRRTSIPRSGPGSPRWAMSGRSSPPPTIRGPTAPTRRTRSTCSTCWRRRATWRRRRGRSGKSRHASEGAGRRPPGHRRVVLAGEPYFKERRLPRGHRATSSGPSRSSPTTTWRSSTSPRPIGIWATMRRRWRDSSAT